MSRCLFLLSLILFTTHTLAAEPSAAEWMPRVEDRTALWWVEGPPKMFGDAARPKEEVLSFEFGKHTMRFDTRHVRPVEGEWECALIVNGRRFTCAGHAQPDDEWQQPARFVESGRFFQRVVIEGLTFADAEGKAFDGTADRKSTRLNSSH